MKGVPMRPHPLQIYNDDTIGRESKPGKPIQKVTLDQLSEKELLFRLVALSQNIRSMLIFFVWVAIFEIIAMIAIFSVLNHL